MKQETVEKLKGIENLYPDLSIEELAKKYSCNKKTISLYLTLKGVIKFKIPLDLTPIIEDYNNGLSLTLLAKKYNVNRHTLSRYFKISNIKVINKQNETKFNENIFDVIDSEEKAYWLGFLFADGYISSSKNTIELSLALKDKEHLEKFAKFMGGGKVKSDNFRCRWSNNQ